jgi:hypothetical protein
MTCQNIIAPDAALYENCPVLSKVEAAVIQQGTSSVIRWEFRDRDGYPVDLSGCFPIPFRPESPDTSCDHGDLSSSSDSEEQPSTENTSANKKCSSPPTGLYAAILNLQRNECHGEPSMPAYCEQNSDQQPSCPPKQIKKKYYFEIRIQPADEPRDPLWIVPANVIDPKNGVIQFVVPNKVSDTGGIFVLNIGLCCKTDRRPVYIHRGLLAVERSAWSKTPCKMPTLSDIRMRIMDTDVENLLQGYVEFTTADILDSVVAAVREWNGTTPYLSGYTYSCYNFPWIEPWLWKVIAHLYNKASLRYMRNKLTMNHGGLQGDDLARDKDYMQIAQMYDGQWKQWMMTKKKELNRGLFSGTVESPYWLMRNDSYGRLFRGGSNGW